MKDHPSPEELQGKIEDGMFPSLGSKKVKVKNTEFVIQEMPVFYTKKLNRLMAPFYSVLTGTGIDPKNIDIQSLINADKIEGFYDTMLDTAALCCAVPFFTEDMSDATCDTIIKEKRNFLEKNAGESTLIKIIKTQMEVNGLVNFCKDILAGVMNMIAGTIKMSNETKNT